MVLSSDEEPLVAPVAPVAPPFVEAQPFRSEAQRAIWHPPLVWPAPGYDSEGEEAGC